MGATQRPLPTGTVTFLFTDIEGSTRLLQELGDEYPKLLDEHRRLVREAVVANAGVEFGTEGDAFFLAFERASDGIAAALAAQHALEGHPWPIPLRVRMGLHTGDAQVRDEDYVGLSVHLAARVASAAHGGQVLVTDPTRQLSEDALPDGATMRDLGEHRLKDIVQPQRLYQVCHGDLQAEFPPPRTLSVRPNNLPLELTSFVGREREVDEVREMLATERLVTLTGAGGSGKTRLARAVATEMLDRFADGVWFVDLAPIAEPALAAQAVAQSLRLREEPGRSLADTIADHCEPRTLMLVLDNCEHLVDACAQLVDHLLRTSPRLRVLATSQGPLGVPGEATGPVPPLGVPPAGPLPPLDELATYGSVALFADRATQAKAGFRLDERNAAAVAAICRRLDGIPLAVELAAARVKILTPEQIDARLDDRFRLLVGGPRAGPSRHQTLRAAVEWSYALLPEPDRVLFDRLSVFAGGFALEDAEQVCSGGGIDGIDVLELVSNLADRSLVLVEPGDEPRYRLLETLRAYADERLREAGAADAVRDRHLDWFTALAERAEPELVGGDQAEWLARLEAQHDNIRAALRASIALGDRERGLRLAGAIWRFWHIRGYYSEARAILGELLAGDGGGRARAKALQGAGAMAWTQGDHAAARAFWEEALEAYREVGGRSGVAMVLGNLGALARDLGELDRARWLWEESLALFRELGDQARIANMLNNLGVVAYDTGDVEGARTLWQESLELRRGLGDVYGIAASLDNLGVLARDHGDPAESRALLEESLGIEREIGDRYGAAATLENIGVLVLATDIAGARAMLRESLEIRRDLGDRLGILNTLEALAAADVASGAGERAAVLLAAVGAEREAIGAVAPPSILERAERAAAGARAALGDDAFARASERGRALGLDDAAILALS